MSNSKIIVLRGELNWAKIVGKARPYTGNPRYDKGPEWTVDLTPDAESRKKIKEAGIEGKLREPTGEKDTRTETYMSFRLLENGKDGEKNPPPRIVNVRNEPWDDSLIGNGSIGEIKVKVVDYGKSVAKGTYMQAVRVLKHVPYDGGSGFEPLSEEDEFFAAPETNEDPPFDTDLDDDVPGMDDKQY